MADGERSASKGLEPDAIASVVAEVRQQSVAHAQRPVRDRARLLLAFKDAVLSRGELLVKALMEECGKVEAEAWMIDVVPTADLAEYWAGEGRELLGDHEVALDVITYPGKRAIVRLAPRGVVGLITPWNFPVAIPLRTLFPALLAGNGVVWKPSEFCPRSAELLELSAEEVFGAGLVRVIHGGAEVGQALVRSGVDAIVFTGSVNAGREVAKTAAEQLIPASLELGGKDAAIVLDDAPIERTARGLVWGAYANAGQNCAAVERVYVMRSRAAALRKRVVELTAELRPGQEVGAITTQRQLEKITQHVSDAVAKGAEILGQAGGTSATDKRMYPPTVLGNVPPTSLLMKEETFGPVLPIVEIDTEEEAVAAVNESPYGLTASVWTRRLSRGEALASRLQVGIVTINNHAFTGAIPSLPWIGERHSGYGCTNSPHALATLTRPRTVVVDASLGKRELWWFPYTSALVDLARAVAVLRNRQTKLLEKLKAVGKLIAARLRRFHMGEKKSNT